MTFRLLILSATLVVGSPVAAQVQSLPITSSVNDAQDDEQPMVQQRRQTPIDTSSVGRTARSSVGQVGQRQTRDMVAQQMGVKPMARIASRIQNRVQSRIRNRIDRNYDSQVNATDAFAVAEDQTRSGGRPR